MTKGGKHSSLRRLVKEVKKTNMQNNATQKKLRNYPFQILHALKKTQTTKFKDLKSALGVVSREMIKIYNLIF